MQGDFQTNVPEGNTVQEILPSWDARTENVRVVELPCQTQSCVATELFAEEGTSSPLDLKCTTRTILSDSSAEIVSAYTQVPVVSPDRPPSSVSLLDMDKQMMPVMNPDTDGVTIGGVVSQGCDLGGFNVASNKGWGIPPGKLYILFYGVKF